MVGLPGAGKSTVSNQLLQDIPDLVIVSSDMFIEQYAKEHNKTYQSVYFELGDKPEKWMKQQIQDMIKNGKAFIWDQTNVFATSRKKKITMLRQKKYDVVAIVVEVAPEELNQRLKNREVETGKKVPEKIITNMLENYTRPDYTEGFSEIYLINDNQAILLPNNQENSSFIKIKNKM